MHFEKGQLEELSNKSKTIDRENQTDSSDNQRKLLKLKSLDKNILPNRLNSNKNLQSI